MYEKFNISLRLNLDDVLGTSEDLILSSLSMAEKNINGTNIFKFSYSKSEPTKVVEYAKKLDSLTIDDILIGIREFVKISNFILSVNDR